VRNIIKIRLTFVDDIKGNEELKIITKLLERDTNLIREEGKVSTQIFI
jgi:hypothetical protein